MTQLLGEAFSDNVDRLVKIMAMILAMEIRPAQCEVDFHDKSMLGRSRTVVPKGHVCTDQIQPEMLKTFDLLSDISMNRGG